MLDATATVRHAMRCNVKRCSMQPANITAQRTRRGDARNIMQHVVLSRGQGETWTAALLKKIIANIVVRTLFAALAALIARPRAHTHRAAHALILTLVRTHSSHARARAH